MVRRKVILLGCPAVGKTSLVARWTKGIFSDRYLATVGVKINKKTVEFDGSTVMLQIWDLAGDVEIKGPAQAYIRGAHACLLVADGTRKDTLGLSLKLLEQGTRELGQIPVALAVNKADLVEKWAVSDAEIASIEKLGISVFKTSAKSGIGVEQAFFDLARKTVGTSIKGVA
jgi:small GTP-binding protein